MSSLPEAVQTLKSKIVDSISDMRDTFTTHEITLYVAKKYQREYFAAGHSLSCEDGSPFKRIHSNVAEALQSSGRVNPTTHVSSKDIFGRSNQAMQWEKTKVLG